MFTYILRTRILHTLHTAHNLDQSEASSSAIESSAKEPTTGSKDDDDEDDSDSDDEGFGKTHVLLVFGIFKRVSFNDFRPTHASPSSSFRKKKPPKP